MSHLATARLFIALDLPSGVREELASWARLALRAAAATDFEQRPREPQHGRGRHHGADHAGGRHGIRVLESESLHITVSFLGSRPVEQMRPLGALVESCAQPQRGEVALGAPVWLPPRRPRALAVEVHDDSGALTALHRAVHDDLEAAELASPASAPARSRGGRRDRAFRPHVTVARLREGTAPGDRVLSPTPQRTFIAPRLVLYRSWLSPEGARYEEIAASEAVPSTGG